MTDWLPKLNSNAPQANEKKNDLVAALWCQIVEISTDCYEWYIVRQLLDNTNAVRRESFIGGDPKKIYMALMQKLTVPKRFRILKLQLG